MSKARHTAVQNKLRGRAFQTKLAQMAGGINIGTLGGEDIMHEEFSYEAKTYNKNAKTYKGKDWMGEQVLSAFDGGLASNKMIIVHVVSLSFTNLYMLRWPYWKDLLEDQISIRDLMGSMRMARKEKFVGNTYMNQAEKNCPDAKAPIVVVHTTGRKHDQDIVLVRGFYWESILENHVTK